jgi:predicted transcriptional regulator
MQSDDLDYRAIAEAEALPMRLAILRAMLADPPGGDPGWSAKTLAAELGVPLTALSYHVRNLAQSGLIENTEERVVRAVVQRFYRLACRAA